MALKVLRQEDVLQLLEGRESAIPQLAEEDEKRRGAVEGRTCPECGEYLKPVLPRDPMKVFQGLGIRYEGECPVHGRVT